jgi:hypothetical protein
MTEAKMLKREEWDILTCEEQIREQIALRTGLQQQMVGRLYPSILEDEIWDLLDRIKELD